MDSSRLLSNTTINGNEFDQYGWFNLDILGEITQERWTL